MSYRLHRRQFLRFATTTLAAAGISQTDFFHQIRQQHRVLAQPTSRKLALLVGINAYPTPIRSLQGCLTDVELQYELLVHRYGFNPRDILVVADGPLSLPGQTVVAPPTRQNILTAFETHLIDQAQTDDVVVFHYSGHGSFVREKNGIPELNGYNGTIVPVDARSSGRDRVDDIMGKTLFLLSKALPTENLTLVLDSCHSGGGVRGNVVVRALDSLDAEPSDRELAYQAQWMSRLQLDEDTLRQLRRQGIAKGVALGSAQLSQLAAEAPFAGFHAGAFTYLLTQYLWQLPRAQPLSEVFVNIARSTRDVGNAAGIVQDPVFTTAPGQSLAHRPVYFLDLGRSPAEAVIREVDGDQVSFWLGGLSKSALSAQDAMFSWVDEAGNPKGEIVQTERQGLMGRGRLQGSSAQSPQPGQLMREQIRAVPANLTLKVGVDPSLGAEALDPLNQLSRIEGLPLTPEVSLDYVLGRFTAATRPQSRSIEVATPPVVNSIGLFTPDLMPVPQTFLAAGESAQAAVARLQPRLKMLLAGKMLASLVNNSVSSLNVEITVLQADTQKPFLSVGSRSAQAASPLEQVLSVSAPVPANTEIRVQITNHEPQDLFVSIVTISSQGTMAIVHPAVWDAPEEAARLPAGEAIQVPAPGRERDRFQFIVRGPAGFFELLVLTSTEPLREALRNLQTIARGRRSRSGNPLAFAEGMRGPGESEDAPVVVVDALMSDLDSAARGGVGIARDRQRIDVERLAAFSLIMEVIESP